RVDRDAVVDEEPVAGREGVRAHGLQGIDHVRPRPALDFRDPDGAEPAVAREHAALALASRGVAVAGAALPLRVGEQRAQPLERAPPVDGEAEAGPGRAPQQGRAEAEALEQEDHLATEPRTRRPVARAGRRVLVRVPASARPVRAGAGPAPDLAVAPE